MELVDPITIVHANYWADAYQTAIVSFGPPEGMEDCATCTAVVTGYEEGPPVIRIPWQPSKKDVLNLMAGGIVWLSMWGNLVPHMVEVQEATL